MKNKILLWVWCFPQNLVGLIVKHVTKATPRGKHYLFNNRRGSVSLGEYIFICHKHYGNIEVLRHEVGHRKQSRMLGWFYLPAIALPSLIWAGIYSKYKEKLQARGISYYSFYTEAWADKLAGIKRKGTKLNK